MIWFMLVLWLGLAGAWAGPVPGIHKPRLASHSPQVELVPLLSLTNSIRLAAPAPGVYRTTPYSCLLVVPGRDGDEQFVWKPAIPSPTMPTTRPDLQFIPRTLGKK